MKLKLHEAARRCGLHPLQCVAQLAKFTEVGDLWPGVDESIVETLLAIVSPDWRKESKRTPRAAIEASVHVGPNVSPACPSVELPTTAVIILEKLDHHRHYGGNKVPYSKIKRHFARDCADVDDALQLLERRGLLLNQGGRHGVYVLPPDKTAEIRALVGR